MRHDFVDWCCELLAPLGSVRKHRMFGSHGLYVDGVFIAIVSQERLYLKVDALTQDRFEAEGCSRLDFTTASGRAGHLNYYSVPDEAMESAAQLQPWARLAMASALRAKAPKTPAKPRKASTSPRRAPSTAPRKRRTDTD